MRILLLALIIIFAFLIPKADATEIDDTSIFYEPIADATAELEASVQRQIDLALKEHYSCNPRFFGRRLAFYLTGNVFFGAIEREANAAESLPKIQLHIEQSIYAGTRSYMTRVFGLGAAVRVAGHLIGTDKIGHFFDMGYHLRAMRWQGFPVETLLAQSRAEEEGLWGIWSTGVKSYGDIAANFDGHRFWRDVFGEGDAPYFSCKDGRFKQVRPFRWADYVNAAWTESINCNRYNDAAIKVAVEQNVRALEARRPDRRFACPIVRESCAEIRRHYGQWIPAHLVGEVVSPECR